MAAKKETVAAAPVVSDKKKALETAMQQIEKMYGKGSIMRYGAESTMNVESIPTGSLSLDLALGIGGLPRGRIVEIYGPESSGKTTLALHVLAVSLLSNLGKLVPLFFYRDRKISERLALSIGMFTRGEVGAGVIFIALGYSLGGPALIISVLTLVLNLILTGGFVVWVKKLALRTYAPEAQQ